MPDYISELKCFGTSDLEFGEIAAPTGTDVSSHRLVFYQLNGTTYNTVSLGSFPRTVSGQDVNVVDQPTSGFGSGGSSMGTFYPSDTIALADGSGAVLQFMTWEENTVFATAGPANGTTSTNRGFADGMPNFRTGRTQPAKMSTQHKSRTTENVGLDR